MLRTPVARWSWKSVQHDPGFAFGVFRLFPARRLLLHHHTRVTLTPKAFDTLVALVERRDRVVSKDELLELLWPGVVVEEASLTQQVFLVRKVLEGAAGNGRYIATVPRRGYQFIMEVRPLNGDIAGEAATPKRRAHWLTLVSVALVLAAAGYALKPASARPRVPWRLTALPPAGVDLANSISVSPDGRKIAITGRRSDGISGVWIRGLDDLEPRLVPHTEGALYPFWSPDGRSLAFFTERWLKRVEIAGGPARELAPVSNPRGGAWSERGVIVFAPSGGSPLFRVDANGGEATPLTALDAAQAETSHRWPTLVQGGQALFFMSRRNLASRFVIKLLNLDDPDVITEVTVAESTGLFADGQLLFLRGTTLFAQPFDLTRRRLTGPETALVEDVWRNWGYEGLMGCSAGGGAVACRRGGADMRLEWRDRSGRELGFVGPRRAATPALDPAGRRLAVGAHDTEKLRDHIWIVEPGREAGWRLTRPEANVEGLVWSPDGRQMVFGSEARGRFDLYVQPVERGSTERLLIGDDHWWKTPTDWSSDGRWIIYEQYSTKTALDVWMIPAAGGPPVPLLRTTAHESRARLSPNRRWLAYQSDESGRPEVYLRKFPPEDRQIPVPVSIGGGTQPRWAWNRRELFFVAADGRLMGVRVDTREPWPVRGKPYVVLPTPLESGGYGSDYFPALDGERFIVSTAVKTAGSGTISVLLR